MQSLQRLEEDIRSYETGVTADCEPPYDCWEMNPGPPQEQSGFLATEPSPQLFKGFPISQDLKNPDRASAINYLNRTKRYSGLLMILQGSFFGFSLLAGLLSLNKEVITWHVIFWISEHKDCLLTGFKCSNSPPPLPEDSRIHPAPAGQAVSKLYFKVLRGNKDHSQEYSMCVLR